MYYGDSFADLATMRLEGKIKGIYAQAYREIEEKLNTFLSKSVIKEKEYEAKVQAGKLSQEWFDRWKSGQVFIGKRWRDLRQNIAQEIYNSRKSATDMINGERKAVFQDNVNYTQYSIDKDHSFGISFTLYDNATVTRLIKEDPDLVPDVKYPDPNIDYAWSKKQITSAITQGILQGESIPELAKRVGKKLQSSNEKSMVRCARTAMTGAQNSGRIQAMHNAQGMGIDVEKLWIATLDGRTRDSHRDLDGQLAKVDEPFHSLLGDIMFPGDPNAAPANVWNCFVGNTKVASDSEIIRSYKHDYSGELVTVKTASGVEFTCTPNHPILTDRGWVGAKFLNNGDRLAETRCIKIDFLGVDPDIDHTLSCFDTIHKFFEEVGIKRTCSLGVNFHGDIPTTNVEIVSKERLLWNYGDSCEFQSKDKLGFKCTTPFAFSKGYFMSGFRRGHVSFLSFVSRMRQTLSFFLARISHSGIHGLGTVSNMDSCIVESKRNSVSGNVQFLGESLAGLSSRVFFDNIVDIKTSSVSHVPVYNLQTQNGYYFVSSDSSIKSDSEKINGIFVIAHNCRCSLGWNYPKYSNQYDTRAARDVDWEDGGQTEQIPYMTYKEWAKWKKTGQLPQRGLANISSQNNQAENEEQQIAENIRNVVQGKDMTGEWQRRQDEFSFEIEDVINAQGFDGLPRVVTQEEFEKAVGESGFIAQRAYSAPDKETLDAYRDQLYNGKWYVDCSVGGARHGQGMYCVADYSGVITSQMQSEMSSYATMYGTRPAYIETFTVTKDFKYVEEKEIRIKMAQYNSSLARKSFRSSLDEVINNPEIVSKNIAAYKKYYGVTMSESEMKTYMEGMQWIKQKKSYELPDSDVEKAAKKIAKKYKLKEHSLVESQFRTSNAYKESMKNSIYDVGSYASLAGYDGIQVSGRDDEDAPYVVILNRTKVIFKRDDK